MLQLSGVGIYYKDRRNSKELNGAAFEPVQSCALNGNN